MKLKHLTAVLLFCLSLSCVAPAVAYDAELFAGQDILVGNVNVSVSVGGDVIVTYTIDNTDNDGDGIPEDEYWCIQHVHADRQIDDGDFPQTRSGNPKVGQFAANEAVDCASEYEVNLGPEPDEEYYVAAHAEVDNTPSCQLEGVLYGTERGTGWIWEIDAVNCVASQLVDTGDPAPADGNINSPNGLAYDPTSNTLYFSASVEGDANDSDLWMVAADAAGIPAEVNAGANNPIDGISAGATFFAGSYWYVVNATDEFRQVDPATGLGSFYCDIDGAATAGAYRFGDSAVTPGTTTLVGSTNGPESTVFSVDVGLGCTGFTRLCDDIGNANSGVGQCADQQQLSYGSNGVLYGHSTGGGEFFVVDASTGLNDSLACDTFNDDVVLSFTDLASGFQCSADQEETAWGDGSPFPGRNWATYLGPIQPTD